MTMNRKQEINKDTQALIKHVTGLDPKDENFRLCVEFAESNFKFHRFLSPDSHKIERAVEGLGVKFQVHSQLPKADDLKELVGHFLGLQGLEGRDHGKTNTHYSLLSLLIELSENPTGSSFQRVRHVEREEEVDDFDWRGYLLDPQDLYFISFASSDSEEEELSDDDDRDKERRVAWVDELVKDGGGDGRLELRGSDDDDDDGGDSDSTLHTDGLQRSFTTANDTTATTVQPGVSQDYQFLENSLVVEYWKGKGREEDSRGGHSASNLAKDWNCYQERLNEFHTPSANIFVTEAQVMRESLWMLSGVCELFIFKHDKNVDGKFVVNPDVYLSHLTPESLSSFLQPFIEKAEQVFRLQTFVKSIVSNTNTTGMTSDPQTYQAFAHRLWAFLADYKVAVKEEEQIVMAQEVPMSLNKMCSDLRPWFDKLDIIHNIYVRGVQTAEHVPGANNAIQASLLLNTLYQVLHETDPLDFVESGSKSELVLSLLIHSSRPLLDIASSWITNGQLSDPKEEFVIQRNKEIKSLDETFWEKAFVSHQGDHTSQNTPPSEPIKKATSNKKDAKKSRKTEQLGTQKYGDLSSTSYSPVFLQNFQNDTLVTGKSMEVLENLGRLREVLPDQQNHYSRPASLYELLVEDLNKKFPVQKGGGLKSEEEEKNEYNNELQIPAKDPVVHTLLNARGTKDTLLNINFASIFSNKTLATRNKQRKEMAQELKVSSMLASNVLRHSESCLQGYVRSRYNIVCPRLVEILKTEYKLMDCIHAMQRYYLMSDGDIMRDFCYPIFHKIESRDYWQDHLVLDMFLYDAIGNRYPEDSERLRVEIVPLTKARGPINVTDCIRLKYHVPWPVDVVISRKCEDRYNSIFSFLLQIKRSKSSLEQLRFEDLSRDQNPPASNPPSSHLGVPIPEDPMDRPTRIHRFRLLRFRLLYFVNSLHNYIMTRILHSSGLEFAQRLEAATDLDQIISIHGAYVDIIYERCLLHSQLSTLKDTIVQILNLSLTCSTHWHQGVDFIKGSFIQEMELKLTRCINFLSSFLIIVIKRGSFPQLESLAVSLISMEHNPPSNNG